MTSWETPALIVWNGAMVLVLLSVIVAVAHPRSRPLRVGWKSKVLWVLSLFVAASFSGYGLPIGAFAVLRQLRKGWKELESDDTEQAENRPLAIR